MKSLEAKNGGDERGTVRVAEDPGDMLLSSTYISPLPRKLMPRNSGPGLRAGNVEKVQKP